MFKPKTSYLAVMAALVMNAGLASADIEVSGYVKNETAFVTSNNQFIGEEKTALDTSSHHSDTLKFENSARVFMNGEFGAESSWHVDLNLIYDSEGVESEFKGHESYTQNEWLREAYIDTRWGNTDIRIGKQQVVWGTADGIKLLDIINPTDFREFNQNTPDDARIPIWMINVDTPIGETGSLQFILAEHEENKIPGLDKDGDSEHPFTVKGVDTITGEVNGFLNLAPKLAGVASTFTTLSAGGFGTGLQNFAAATVYGFVDGGAGNAANFNGTCAAEGTGAASAACLNTLTQNAAQVTAPATVTAGFANNNNTELTSATSTVNTSFVYSAANPTSAFEYMPNASFATFNTFAGSTAVGGAIAPMSTTYTRDYPDDDKGNFGVRYKSTTDSGINWSVNYFYHYDANPTVDISMHDRVTGEELTTELRSHTGAGFGSVLGAGSAVVSRDAVPNTVTATAANAVSVLLKNSAGAYYGACDPGAGGCSQAASATFNPNGVEMRFTEFLNRIHSLGGSLDMAIDKFSAPVVLRAEFLYDKDTMQPVIDKRLLGIGDLEGALQPEKQDMFKYVIGVDVTVATNLLISTQFIQFRNLDYTDTKRTCFTEPGGTVGSVAFDCSKYTGDAPTLNLSNGLRKAEENKEFVSIFLSKPFGSDLQGRWNNIIIIEDTGGYWNRFDVEYGFTDELIGSVELNAYWGDEDSWFGQLENSSNIQVGVKYIFD